MSVSLCFYLFVSLSLFSSLSRPTLYRSLFSLSPSLSVFFYLSIYLSVSFCRSLSLFPSRCLCMSVCLCLYIFSLCGYIILSVSHRASSSHYMQAYLCTLCQYLFASVSACVCLAVSVSPCTRASPLVHACLYHLIIHARIHRYACIHTQCSSASVGVSFCMYVRLHACLYFYPSLCLSVSVCLSPSVTVFVSEQRWMSFRLFIDPNESGISPRSCFSMHSTWVKSNPKQPITYAYEA